MTTPSGPDLGSAGKDDPEAALEAAAVARAARMLGLWAAELMGLDPARQADYAEAVIRYANAHTSGEAILRKIAQDLVGAGLKFNEDQVRGKHDEFLAISRGQLQAEG